MKISINKYLTLAIVGITLFSCEDVFEKDITDETVSLISPIEGAIITSNITSFHWNALDGATKYRIQILNNSQAIIVDSIVQNNSFNKALIPGSYKWKVRGENFAYQSQYSNTINFSVVQSIDLTNQQVILTSPNNNFYTNTNTITCGWDYLSAATNYSLELINNSNGQSIILQQNNITTNSFILNSTVLANEGQYQWKVKGVNITSNTNFSNRNINIDRTNPNQPQPSNPANNSSSTANQLLNFSWNMGTDSGIVQSPIHYVIEFSNSSSFTDIIQTTSSTNTSFQQSFTNIGNYFWRIKSVDEAGNSSTYSSIYKFTIN